MPITTRSGRAVSYTVHGDGPPVVVQPGIYSLGEHWSLLGYTAALRPEWTVVEIDPIAHGGSAAPDQLADYLLERRVDDVLAVLDEIGADTARYWGYSMGAWIGCGLAKHASDRLAGLVVGGWDPAGGIGRAYTHVARTRGLPLDSDWCTLLIAQAHAHPVQAPVIDAGDREAFRRCQVSMEGSTGLDGPLLAAGVPALLYAGTEDPYHDHARAVADRGGLPFASIEGADHTAAWYRPEAVLPHVLPFLADRT